MTQPQHLPSSHGDKASSTTAPPFSSAEIAEFRSSDKSAGFAIVVLMSAVFGFGLALYTYIAMTI